MMISYSLIFFFCFFLQLIVLISGGKYDYKKTSNSLFAHFLVQDFGIADNGVLSFNYNTKQLNTSTTFAPNTSLLKLVVMDSSQKGSWYGTLYHTHTTDSNDVRSSCQQPSLYSKYLPINSQEDTVFIIGRNFSTANLFSVLLLQCKELDEDNKIEVSVNVEMKNIKSDSNIISAPSTANYDSFNEDYTYLSIEDTPYLHFFPFEISVYSLLILGICFQIYLTQAYTLKIHYIFALTLFFFLLHSISLQVIYQKLDKGDEVSVGLYIFEAIFASLSDTAILFVLLAISFGWSILRTRLAVRERNLLYYPLLFYFIFFLSANICDATLNSKEEQDEPVTCSALSIFSFVVRCVILLIMVVYMNFTVTQLRAMIINSPWVPSTPIQYARCQQFHHFRTAFLFYLLLPSAFLLIRITMLDWGERWIESLLNRLLEILFIFHIGVTFSPLQEPLLSRAFDGSLNNEHSE